jgi:transcriptional regulator NrdR family protein
MIGICCPHCDSTLSTVTETRKVEDGVKRRRRCFKCERTFTTVEKAGT